MLIVYDIVHDIQYMGSSVLFHSQKCKHILWRLFNYRTAGPHKISLLILEYNSHAVHICGAICIIWAFLILHIMYIGCMLCTLCMCVRS
jgi:hypothetical protein